MQYNNLSNKSAAQDFLWNCIFWYFAEALICIFFSIVFALSKIKQSREQSL